MIFQKQLLCKTQSASQRSLQPMSEVDDHHTRFHIKSSSLVSIFIWITYLPCLMGSIPFIDVMLWLLEQKQG